MSPNTTHPQYDSTFDSWSRARDVLAGEDAIKAAGTRYLPQLDTQSTEEYDAYKNRALFFNATARSAEGYLGLIFRRPPFFKIPVDKSALATVFADFRADADLRGTTFDAYAKQAVSEVIAVGRAGTLIDYETEGENRTFIRLYRAEDILNWRVGRIRGRNVPTMVVLN